MARPELLDSRPTWPVTIRLEPLGAADTESLIGTAFPTSLRSRITAAAAGNPLFISEMLAMAHEADDEVEVPASLKALLAARLDQLDPAERRVLECGSVEGEVFHRGAVQALTPEEAQVTPRLAALVRRELIRSDRPQFVGEDGFRFRHLLIRDAAYDALPKSNRADLHQRFAAWLDEHGRELVERDEIVGYHLEQAAQCLADLGQPDHGLAAEAAARLAAAGSRARWQLDRRTARSLLQRAVDLSDHPDVHVVVDLARVLETPLEGAELLDEAADRAEREGDVIAAALARAAAAYSRVWILKAGDDELERLALEALPLLEAAGDHAGLAEVWYVLAQGVYNGRCQYAQIEYASERANGHALLAGLPPRLGMMGVALLYGPRPVSEVLPIFEARAETYRHPGTAARPGGLPGDERQDRRGARSRAGGRRPTSRVRQPAHCQPAHGGHRTHRGKRAGRGRSPAGSTATTFACAASQPRSPTMLRCWDARSARSASSTTSNELAAEGREYGAETDPLTQALWRQVTALVQAHRGNHADAERFAREAVEYTLRTDSPWTQGDALCDLATVLEADGRIEDALAALRQALAPTKRRKSCLSPAAPVNDSPRSKLRRPETQADAGPVWGIPSV